MVAHSRDDDVALDLRLLEELGRDHHAALFVEVGVGRPRVDEPLETARRLAERIQRGESRLETSNPILTTPGLDARIDAAGDDDAVGEGLAVLGGKGETVLVIDRVLERAEEHRGSTSLGPVFFTHCSPLCPTLTHLSTLFCSSRPRSRSRAAVPRPRRRRTGPGRRSRTRTDRSRPAPSTTSWQAAGRRSPRRRSRLWRSSSTSTGPTRLRRR